jgi:hypothetical protein
MEMTNDDFVLSVRESFDNGAGEGGELFFAHWHAPPFECPELAAPQQQVVPFLLPQQLLRPTESAAAFPQQKYWARDPIVQWGHNATDAASARTVFRVVARAKWSAQLQGMRGRESTGTSTAASQTRTLAGILLHNRTAGPRGFEWFRNSRRLPLDRMVDPIDIVAN